MEKIFGDQSSGKSRVMATILQLKVAKRRLFEKVTLERYVGENLISIIPGSIKEQKIKDKRTKLPDRYCSRERFSS